MEFMDDEDECVLFEGTPLHQSLVESGVALSEFDIQKKLTVENTEKPAEHCQQVKVKDTSTLLERVVLKLHFAVRLVVHFLFPSKNMSLEEQYNRTVARDLLNTGVLDEDDKEFLENYLEETGLTHEQESKQVLTWRSKLWVVSLLPSMLMNLHQNRQLCSKREIILSHAKAQLRFLKLMKKCLRLIQETELVARGFTLVSQKSPISLIEQSQLSGVSSRQCPELRRLLFNTAREVIILCRESTKTAVTHFPINPEVDSMSSYLAFQSLQSYGPCLQESADKEDELFDLTDGFSVAALKGMVHLCHLHQSEYVKRLVLILYHHNKEQQQAIPATTNLQQEITRLTDQFETWSGTLDRSYSFHNSRLLKQEPSLKVRGQSSPYRDINVAVHSLDLHLQAALTRVRALSSWLEKLDEESQTVDLNFLSHDHIAGMLQPIKAELDSCKGCWEEGINRMDKLLKQTPVIEKHLTDKEASVPVCRVEPIKVVPVEDPIIVDQVFEAYTDEDHVEKTDYSWEQPLTAEEKEKKKRAKEEALRMLKELKSVITVRSQEMEKREADALKRYKNQETDPQPGTHRQTPRSDDVDIMALTGSSIEDQETKHQLSPTVEVDLELRKSECVDNTKAGLIDSAGGELTVQVDLELRKSEFVDNTKAGLIDSADGELTEDDKKHSIAVEDIPNLAATNLAATSMQTEHGSVCMLVPARLGISSHGHCNLEDKLLDEDVNGEERSVLNIRKEGNENDDNNSDKIDNLNESSDYLDISGGTSQKSLKITNLRDKHSEQDRTYHEEANASDKSSSFTELSNTDNESVYSAISYTDDIDHSGNTGTAAKNDSITNCDDTNFETSNCESKEHSPSEKEEENSLTLEERLHVFHGANLSFTSNIAALAVARSQTFGLPKESTFGGDTFGDDSDDGLVDDDNEILN